jgi:nucleotide-binding universal stress UspA family protein
MMKLLIAYDGSDPARVALSDLLRAGLPDDVDALVFTVAETALFRSASSTGERNAQALHEAASTAAEGREYLRRIFPRWDIASEGIVGSAASGIVGKAADWGADLVVVGSHGRSLPGRLLLGSVSHGVVNRTRCSVRVARFNPSDHHGPLRLLIGVDGSDDSDAAVETVRARRWPSGTRVRLVTGYGALYLPAAVEEIEAQVYEVQKPSKEALESVGLSVDGIAVEGGPAAALVREAEEFGADCIFVGASGLSSVGRLLLGSVSVATVNRAHCSVEIVRSVIEP